MPPAKKSTAPATRSNKTTRAGRGAKVLAEKTQNIPEEVDDEGEEEELPVKRRGKKRTASEVVDAPGEEAAEDKSKAKKGRTKAAKVTEPEDDDELVSDAKPEITAAEPAKKKRKPKAPVVVKDAEVEIPETQQPEKQIPETQPAEITHIMEEKDKLELRIGESRPRGRRPFQPRGVGTMTRKSISASEVESDEPILRRRIGELTRQHQALEVKYRDLREIAVQEAERNFDRLKKQGEERANTDKELIATLKARLASETETARNVEGLRRQLEDSQKQAEELQGKLTAAQAALAELKTETKALSTKLAAARAAEPVAVKMPGSAMKINYANNRQMANAAEAANQLAHKKEDLYGDLTGLLVCGVKHEKGDEVFDCVQTGRNGTLHFKLAVAGSSESIDDTQFMYMPQLNSARDQELIAILPDYLVEEITFPRLHAAKFYSRVVRALSEKPEPEE
ncbi:chromosome segregation protein Csm1/Pcs1-domain-containing protein [Xylaria sp. CBS 124048]|nr:chromosome segregation protein Csm1/Pcs1-domain-containing protein [Xylaria sp. CBS 124048]